jgi:molybdate transport system ATP-binding protein
VRLLVTHDPLEAAALAETVVILEGGHVVQQGTFTGVTEHPWSGWAARMVGVNLLRGDAVSGVLRVAGGGTLAFAGDVSGAAMAAIQPRAIALYRELPSGKRPAASNPVKVQAAWRASQPGGLEEWRRQFQERYGR